MTSFSPLLHDTSPASWDEPWHFGARMASLASDTASFTIPGVDSPSASVQSLTLQITQHPQFNHLFSLIKSCLQLTDHVWTTYSQLRASRDARLQLECLHPSIWHSPPEDVWTIIVRLREELAFYNVQASIIANLERSYFQIYHDFTVRPLQGLPEDGSLGDGGGGGATAATMMLRSEPEGSRAFADALTPSYDDSQEPRPELEEQSTLASCFPQSPNPRQTQRHGLRKQAPDGLWYHCPSQGCSKPYKRLGHYKKHIRKTHPDFGPRNPHHTPSMSLKPRTFSGPDDRRPNIISRGAEQPTAAVGVNGRQYLASSQSRRGSVLSSCSVDSTSVSLLENNGGAEAPFFSTSKLSGPEAAILQDSSLWHMGGGAFQ